MSKRNLTSVVVVAVLLCMVTASSQAQYVMGKSYLGPRIGIGVNGSSLAIGAGYEYGVTEDISVGALIDYYQWSYTAFAGFGGKYTYIVFGAQGNYHFGKLLKWDSKLDPFAGLVLGYENISWKWDNQVFTGYSASSSGLVFGGQAGLRYFVSPSVALYGQAGFGITYLKVGVDFVL
ncbi:MAG: hypothetical protein WBW16_07750 [Bacteroidota bacterium]